MIEIQPVCAVIPGGISVSGVMDTRQCDALNFRIRERFPLHRPPFDMTKQDNGPPPFRHKSVRKKSAIPRWLDKSDGKTGFIEVMKKCRFRRDIGIPTGSPA